MSRRRDFEDDGRTIADMSGLDGNGGSGKEPGLWPGQQPGLQPGLQPFSWGERFRYIGAALGAALLIALVFLGGIALVIWLITLYGK